MSTLYLADSHQTVQNGDIPTYAALSHRWGKAKPSLMLTKASLQQWRDGIQLQALPKTFLDAVRITRKLGIPYLWIDCICIVQDDEGDWQKEASMMASVYRNAHITIANAASNDSNGGCSIDGSLRSRNFKLDVQASDGSLQHFFVRSPLRRPDMLKGSPLFDRGWILQEQILSRRTVYFTKDQMIWQCHTTNLAEDGVAGAYTHAPTKDLAQYEFGMVGGLSRAWWTWMKNYSSRQLTNPSDKMAALAGITQLYQEETGDTPLVGLWKNSIVQDLLWYREQTIDTSITSGLPSHKFPSWSWASLDGAPLGIPKGLSLYPSYSDARYMGHDIIWSKEPLTSTLIKACITLRGRLLEMKDQLHLQNSEILCSSGDHYGNRHLGPLMRRLSGDMIKFDLTPVGPYIARAIALRSQAKSSTTQAETRSEYNCPLRVMHGTSEVQLDRKIEPGTKIFGLFMGTSWSKEEEVMLLLTPVEGGFFRRLGIAMHSHVQVPRTYCRTHGWQSKEFTAGDTCRKLCTDVEYVHHDPIQCFQDIRPQTITIV